MTDAQELLTALQTKLALSRNSAGLWRLRAECSAELAEPDAAWCRRMADEAESNLLGWELAAECLRQAIALNASTETMLTGQPVEPERPRLRLVSGDEA